MIVAIIIISVGLIVFLLWYNASESGKWHRKHAGKEISADDDHFYGYLFYYNPNDKRIFIPKRTGGGYTVNFANPLSVITGVAIILALIAVYSY